MLKPFTATIKRWQKQSKAAVHKRCTQTSELELSWKGARLSLKRQNKMTAIRCSASLLPSYMGAGLVMAVCVA